MKFYFCETCGKRITDQQVEEGAARDKKLKGVYCKDCAVGIMTIEFNAITGVQLRDDSPCSQNATASVGAKRGSGINIPASARGSARLQASPGNKPQAAHPNYSSTAIYGGIAVFIIVAAFFAAMGTRKSERATEPASVATRTTATIAQHTAQSKIIPAPAPGPIKPVSPEVSKEITSPAALAVETRPDTVQDTSADPETVAKVDYDRMVTLVGSMEKSDNVGRLAAIDAFLKKHGESTLSQSARTLRDGIVAMGQFNKSHASPNLSDLVHEATQLAEQPTAKAVDPGGALQRMVQQALNLLSQMNISAALRSVEQDQEAPADARNALKAALATLQKRDAAWHEALAKNVGQKVRLETKGGSGGGLRVGHRRRGPQSRQASGHRRRGYGFGDCDSRVCGHSTRLAKRDHTAAHTGHD